MNKNDIVSGNEDKILVREIVQEDGNTPFSDWINSVRDPKILKKIRSRINLIRDEGYFGPGRFPSNSPISELSFDTGPGYRVYFVRCGDDIVILINGGVKNGQTSDIIKAKNIWQGVINEYRTVEEALQRCTVRVSI